MITITKDFITLQEEQEILSHIRPTSSRGNTNRNRVLRYGSKLPYSAPMASKDLPQWAEFLISRLVLQGLLPERPDHITLNEYHKGQSIDWHIDSKTSGDIITVLSLKSDATMGLRDVLGQEVRYPVPARSLCQMSGKERWEDRHCIYPVDSLRYSVVFRKGTKK